MVGRSGGIVNDRTPQLGSAARLDFLAGFQDFPQIVGKFKNLPNRGTSLPGVPLGLGSSRCLSDGAQIIRRGLASLSISNNVEGDLLSLVKPLHPCPFDRADVHEDILAAIIGWMKPKPFWLLNHFTVPCAIWFPFWCV